VNLLQQQQIGRYLAARGVERYLAARGW